MECIEGDLKGLKTTVGKLVENMSTGDPGKLPSQTEVNPKEQAHMVHLRSGKTLPDREPVVIPSSPPTEEAPAPSSSQPLPSPPVQDKDKAPIRENYGPLPYPTRAKNSREEAQFKKFINTIRKLSINIPFADAIT